MAWAEQRAASDDAHIVDVEHRPARSQCGATADDALPLLAFPDDTELRQLRNEREREARERTEAMLEQARGELLERWLELQDESAEPQDPGPLLSPVIADRPDRLHAMVSAAPDAIISFDTEGLILSCNPATERLFEATAAALVGSALVQWLPEFALPSAATGVEPSGTVFEAGARTALGREFTVELALSFVEHAEGRLGAAVLRDVTERRRYETELRHLNASLQAQVEETRAALARLRETQQQLVLAEKLASLGGLVAGIAHEINTPVGIAVTAASHLAEQTQEFTAAVDSGTLKRSQLAAYTQVCSQSAQIILGNLERAAKLVLSFKRVAVDQSTEDVREIVLADYMHEVLTNLQPRLRQTRVRLSLDCDPALKLLTVPGAWSQIVTNLAINALEHAFAGGEGHLRFAVRRSGNRLELRVADDGAGIPPEVLPKIFDPFFTTRRAEGGSGLGLHVVFNLVHGTLDGTVRVESRLNEGTEFIIDCPATWSSS